MLFCNNQFLGDIRMFVPMDGIHVNSRIPIAQINIDFIAP